MVDYNLINSLGITDEDIAAQMGGADISQEAMLGGAGQSAAPQPGSIIKGRIVNVVGGDVIVEVGFKSEGSVELAEFDDPASIQIGSEIEVFLDAVESDSELIVLSKRKADRIRGW